VPATTATYYEKESVFTPLKTSL